MLKRRTKIKAKAEKGATRELDSIQIQGAREHNLKNIDLEWAQLQVVGNLSWTTGIGFG